MLDFVNVDFIYSTTNNNDSHFVLGYSKISKDTGFPQLASSDIIKHHFSDHGTPKSSMVCGIFIKM